jgi:hypothetical protein
MRGKGNRREIPVSGHGTFLSNITRKTTHTEESKQLCPSITEGPRWYQRHISFDAVSSENRMNLRKQFYPLRIYFIQKIHGKFHS